ncbi:MAG: DUF664 domain-containing protein [Planctomycetes bacterium]|nr:DUF664 domain-containing protein [Planctomycetota bacterium]
MDNELKDFFLRLYVEDYTTIKNSINDLSVDQLWKATAQGVSVANIICHTCEMEAFWIDWGLCGHEFDRDRQLEFDRNRDISLVDLVQRIDQRMMKTQNSIAGIDEQQWVESREFHGDTFTGKGILLWHIHHLGLHRGHVQAHVRWLM